MVLDYDRAVVVAPDLDSVVLRYVDHSAVGWENHLWYRIYWVKSTWILHNGVSCASVD